MIKTQGDDEIDEEEVTNDIEINKMLARNADELVIFNRMDKERYEIDKRIYPNFKENTNYRLIQENEVPDWVKIKQRKHPQFIHLF